MIGRALRSVLLAGAALAASAVQAQCLPRSAWAPINLTGGDLMQGVVPGVKGEWHALWCPSGTFNGPTETWTLYTHATLDKYRTVSASAVWSAVSDIMKSADPAATIRTLLKTGEYIPPVGTQDRYDWEALLYAACQQAAAVGYGTTPKPVTLVNGCKPPTPLPTTPNEIWRVTPSGSSLFTASGGKLVSPISGRRAAGGTQCDNTKPAIKLGSSTYYPLQGGAANEYAACQKAS